MGNKPYQLIVDFWEEQFALHGDRPEGVGWRSSDAESRYRVMLDVIRQPAGSCSVLDLGCGASHLLDFIVQYGIPGIAYQGIDISPKFISVSRAKHPTTSYQLVDVLAVPSSEWPHADYIVMNGLFTFRGSVSQNDMFDYMRRMLRTVFPHARIGMAFNVMSPQVDWERDDLFHLSPDVLISFLSREITRHIVLRHDYGLYEYTVYAYRDPVANAPRHPKRLLDPKSSIDR